MFAVNARRAIAVASAATVKLHWDRREGDRERWERSRPLRCEELTLQATAQRLLPHAVQFAELHGLLYGAKDRSSDASAATQCPVAMLPFKIPRRAFDECVALSPLWNQLVDAAARDLQWLYATLEPAAKADDFTARLLQMSRELHKEGLRQPMMLGIHRSDYMLHESGTPRFLQVELNTIASSMASHSANVRKLHNYVLGRYGSQSDDVGRSLQAHFGVPSTQIVDRLPANVALKEIPRAFAKAHAAHGVKDAFVLFVVQDDERNFADQRFLEYALWEDPKRDPNFDNHPYSNLRGRTMESKCSLAEKVSTIQLPSIEGGGLGHLGMKVIELIIAASLHFVPSMARAPRFALLSLVAAFALLRWSAPSFAGARGPKVSFQSALQQKLTAFGRHSCTARAAVGIFYATQTGNTETVASKLAEATGLEASDYDGEDFSDLDGVIAGCPTWNTGADEYRSGTTWDDYLDTIKEYDLKGKVVAVFGCGDSQSYADNFCDGIEELHDAFRAAGAKMVGYVDESGYSYGESKSVKDGKFLGLPLDEDNEDDQTDDRIAAWVEQLKGEGMPL
ncbi:unnamed protein product [Symbiodinium sp. CCMP2456]|nr:unnamed protein product [Symbiodinium sp. CCMP2456]